MYTYCADTCTRMQHQLRVHFVHSIPSVRYLLSFPDSIHTNTAPTLLQPCFLHIIRYSPNACLPPDLGSTAPYDTKHTKRPCHRASRNLGSGPPPPRHLLHPASQGDCLPGPAAVRRRQSLVERTSADTRLNRACAGGVASLRVSLCQLGSPSCRLSPAFLKNPANKLLLYLGHPVPTNENQQTTTTTTTTSTSSATAAQR